MVIEGNRGLGKSTFAFELANKVHRYFRIVQRETGGIKSEYKGWYEFKPLMQLKHPKEHRAIIYTQSDVINFYDKWHKVAISDEAINVAFNREFFSTEQKNLIKMINMNRDHGNLLIMCVPQFQNLDNQIKNLCKIRITIARRGIAIIQTPNRTVYNKDKWDSANNERIEREWLRKGTGLPQYSRLNTFRGMIKFPPLTARNQWIYDKIKGNERNVIKSDLGVTDGKKQDPFDALYEKLIAGGVRNSSIIEGFAMSNGLTLSQLHGRIVTRLKKDGKPHMISDYLWDRKAKKGKTEEELFRID